MTKEQKLAKILEKIAAGKIKRPAAAAELGVSERHLNRLMKAFNVRRPPSPVHERAETAEVRRQVKQAAAYAVFNGEMAIEAAAQAADCSERTIYRLLETFTRAPKRSTSK